MQTALEARVPTMPKQDWARFQVEFAAPANRGGLSEFDPPSILVALGHRDDDERSVRAVPTDGVVELYFQTGGHAELRTNNELVFEAVGRQAILVLHRAGVRSEWRGHGAEHGFVSIICGESTFIGLRSDDGDVGDDDLSMLECQNGQCHRLDPAIAKLAEQMLDRKITTRLTNFFSRVKALEILCEAASRLELLPPPPAGAFRLAPRDVELLNYTRSVIKEQIADGMTIPQLARRVGLNQQKLKLGFKHLFGQTIFEFTLEQRMTAAIEMLQRDRLPIKTVAAKVGYRCPTSFSRAFERHWGVLPSAVSR